MNALGNLQAFWRGVEASWRVLKGARKRLKMGSKMEPKRLLEFILEGTGSVQAVYGLLEGSWRALESLRSRKEVLLTRSSAL